MSDRSASVTARCQPRRRKQQGRAEQHQHELVLREVHGTDAVDRDQGVGGRCEMDGSPGWVGSAQAAGVAQLRDDHGRGQVMR